MNDVFLNYQKNWIGDTSCVKVCEKSRRIGLTWAEAADNVLAASSAEGMDVWYIGYNRDMTREYIETCAGWARHFNRVCSEVDNFELLDEDKKILSYRIEFESGHKITALSSRPSNLRGKQGKVIIDEAAFHDDLAGLMQSALAFTIWGGKVAVISTHFGEDNPFNELVKEIRAGKKPYSLHRITFDEAVDDGLYERIAKVTGINQSKIVWANSIYNLYGDGADEELRCIPARSGGAYFTTAMVESCMANVPVIKFIPPADDFLDWEESRKRSFIDDWLSDNIELLVGELPKDRRHFFGEDFGRSGDLSVFWIMTEQADLTLSTPFIVELRNAPFDVQRQIAHYIIGNLPMFYGGAFDARGNGQYLAEVTRTKFGSDRILEVQISDKFYLSAFPKLKARFEDKTILVPKNADILADFRQVKVIKGVPKLHDGRTGDENGRRHGDSAIACLMAVYAREMLGASEPWSYNGERDHYTEKLLKNY